MAITVGCDRCNKIITGEVFRRGHVVKREYCKRCVKAIDAMTAEIDELHTNLAAQWQTGLEKIRGEYSKDGGLLPDVSI